MVYIDLESTDVYENFGLEYYLAKEKNLEDTVFLFWRTTPTLMLGKYQNLAEEVNLPYAREQKMNLVRRMSGGGTITRTREDGSLPSLTAIKKRG